MQLRPPAAMAFAATLFSTFLVLTIALQQGQAQTFTVIHNLSDPSGGSHPFAGLTTDGAGNLYGTTTQGGGGGNGHGAVFKLTHKNSAWVLTELYAFKGGNDGGYPVAKVVFGPDGSLYGTTSQAGGTNGTVFKLQPPATFCKAILCPWTETVLYRFTGGPDGAGPGSATLIFDQARNLYGTTQAGGYVGGGCGFLIPPGCGVVFQLTPFNGGWTESVLHTFAANGEDGYYPWGGLTFDRSGNLYGTTRYGDGDGTVFELTPSGSGWTERILYTFHQDQADPATTNPDGDLISDALGNIYGTGSTTNYDCCGAVFQIAPDGTYSEYSFPSQHSREGILAGVVMDAAGNLYGTTYSAGSQKYGSVFKLTLSNGTWTETDLYDFTGGSDGGYPAGGVLLGANGNLYGTASVGGNYGDGVVWEITP